MASVSSIRSRVDQENSQAFRGRNGVQGKSFGPAKSFNSTGNNAPLATPRRALGDVGNMLMTPGNVTKKCSLLPYPHNNLLQSKTPGAKRTTHSTPHGKASSKQIGFLSLKQNKKKAFEVRGDHSTSDKSSVLEKDFFKRENMIPFTDQEKPLPRGPAINTILKNVSQLYRGCLQPVDNQGISLECGVLKTEAHTYTTRPETDSLYNWFGFNNDFSDLTSNVPSSSLEDIELPPIDTDLSDLGLP